MRHAGVSPQIPTALLDKFLQAHSNDSIYYIKRVNLGDRMSSKPVTAGSPIGAVGSPQRPLDAITKDHQGNELPPLGDPQRPEALLALRTALESGELLKFNPFSNLPIAAPRTTQFDRDAELRKTIRADLLAILPPAPPPASAKPPLVVDGADPNSQPPPLISAPGAKPPPPPPKPSSSSSSAIPPPIDTEAQTRAQTHEVMDLLSILSSDEASKPNHAELWARVASNATAYATFLKMDPSDVGADREALVQCQGMLRKHLLEALTNLGTTELPKIGTKKEITELLSALAGRPLTLPSRDLQQIISALDPAPRPHSAPPSRPPPRLPHAVPGSHSDPTSPTTTLGSDLSATPNDQSTALQTFFNNLQDRSMEPTAAMRPVLDAFDVAKPTTLFGISISGNKTTYEALTLFTAFVHNWDGNAQTKDAAVAGLHALAGKRSTERKGQAPNQHDALISQLIKYVGSDRLLTPTQRQCQQLLAIKSVVNARTTGEPTKDLACKLNIGVTLESTDIGSHTVPDGDPQVPPHSFFYKQLDGSYIFKMAPEVDMNTGVKTDLTNGMDHMNESERSVEILRRQAETNRMLANPDTSAWPWVRIKAVTPPGASAELQNAAQHLVSLLCHQSDATLTHKSTCGLFRTGMPKYSPLGRISLVITPGSGLSLDTETKPLAEQREIFKKLEPQVQVLNTSSPGSITESDLAYFAAWGASLGQPAPNESLA